MSGLVLSRGAGALAKVAANTERWVVTCAFGRAPLLRGTSTVPSLLRPEQKVIMVLVVLSGLVCGLGGFTFVYAKGGSYLSNDPEACHNCHVMNAVFEGWTKGGHQHVATCNDCHVPHDFLGKWYTKADNGLHHSWAFTFEQVPSAISAKQRSRAVVQENCVRCHTPLAGHAFSGPSGTEESLQCIACHREIGHVHGQ
jgi:cytochrome c nitrite reductase small subunit